ncbi:MAG: serine hydrolase [bacterium]|nr:serine hydrolase [bacterium]
MKAGPFLRGALLLLLAATSATCSLPSEGEYQYRVPPQLDDGWPVASLEEAGLDVELVSRLTRDIHAGRYRGLYALVVIKDGRLVHEAYFGGRDRDSLNRLFSVTKSVTSALIGIAIDQGSIAGVEQSVLDLLPAYDVADSQAKRAITLEHLLTQTSGLAWDELAQPYSNPDNIHRRMWRSRDWMKFTLELPLRDEPGSRWAYSTGNSHLLGGILKNATGIHADAFAERHLFAPLGIGKYDWNRDPQGHPCTGGSDGGLRLRARDIAKLGLLYLDRGRWQGRQVVPEAWVERSTKPHIEAGFGGYGYQWWTRSFELLGSRLDHFIAIGHGGQRIYVVPDLRLVVVLSAWDRADDADVLGPLLLILKAALGKTGAQTGEGRPPSYQPAAGRRFELVATRTGSRRQSFLGQEGGGDWQERIEYLLEVGSAAAEGLALTMEFGGGSHEGEAGSAELSALSGRRVDMTLSPTGELSQFKRFAALPRIAIPGRAQPLDRERYINMVRQLFPRLPDRRVELGDSWTAHEVFAQSGPGGSLEMTVDSTYTLMEKTLRDGIDCLEIDVRSVTTVRGETNLGGLVADVYGIGTGTGSVAFLPAWGMFLERASSVRLKGRLANDELGTVSTYHQEVETEIVVRPLPNRRGEG